MKFNKEKTEQIKKVLRRLICFNCDFNENYFDFDNPICTGSDGYCDRKVDDALEEISILLDD